MRNLLKLSILFALGLTAGAAFGLPAVVQTKTVDCTTGCTNVTITPTTATTAGNLLVVVEASDAPVSSIKYTSTAWVRQTVAANSNAATFVSEYSAPNASSVSSIAVTQASWHGILVFYEISGANAVDSCWQCVYSATTTLSTTTTRSLSITTKDANELLIGVMAGFPNTPTTTGSLTSTDYSGPLAVISSGAAATTGSYSYGGTWASGSGRPTIGLIGFYQTTTLPSTNAVMYSPTGGSYGATQTVTLSDVRPGAVIHYTTNGTTPTSASSTYTTPLTVSATQTIKAIAIAPVGYTDSPVNSNTYTINGITTPRTFYVRSDGGSRYSANATSGQCNGQYDVSYASTGGTGINQNCAYSDYRYLYDDQHSYNSLVWAINGGDTVIIRGGPWRVGWQGNTGTSEPWCSGGGNGSCTNPPIPSGTAAQHTRILGENYASCSTGHVTNRSSLTQLFGGHGVWQVLTLAGSQYVDVECLELTTHAQCITHGDPMLPKGCSSSLPVDDYDSEGVSTDVNTHDVLMQDLWIHGNSDRGVKGAIGGVVTAQRVDIAYNGMAGWDFDDGTPNGPGGNGTASVNGTWNFLYSTIEWSGCNQIYPGTGANTCYGVSTGGYGDGVGSPPGGCMNVNLDHSAMNYNTQDGLDIGHEDAGPSGAGYMDQNNCTYTVTNSYAFGNNGAPYKWGPNNSPAVMTNNVLIGNCSRMKASVTGADTGFNAHLGDWCRSGDGVAFNFHSGGVGLFANNTLITYFQTAYLASCWEGDYQCPGSSYTFKNNITYGLEDPTQSYGANNGGIGGFYFNYGGPSSTVLSTWNRSNNQYYGVRNITCPTGSTGEICSDPLFLNEPAKCLVDGGAGCTFTEATWDVFLSSGYSSGASYNLTATSPANGAGATYTGIPTTDYNSTATTSPPVIGALNFYAGASPSIVFTGIQFSGGRFTIQ
jgi:hypothetical protein